MRTTPLALALLLALAGDGLARSDQPATGKSSEAPAIYLIEFVEPALASYRGGDLGLGAKFAGLKATSPAITGARKLDVEAPASLAYREALAELREERLLAAGAKFGRVLQPLFVYDVASNGVALELTAAEAASIAKMPGVRFVERDFTRRLLTDSGPQWIKADVVWNTAIGGSRGEGAVVGVIDSGINRTHPSFAGQSSLDGYSHLNPRARFYGRCAEVANAAECNNKLIGLYDFSICTGVHANSECNDRETNDGTDPDGHGTHVAGTAVGNPLNMSLNLPTGPATRRISGVAPRANIIAYKACEEEEDCRGTWLKAAIDQAVADGVDVINYSIGGNVTNPWNRSDSIAMLGARDAGVVVVVAAGNEGPGTSTVTAPADSPWVIAVANATHDRGIVNRLVDLSGGATAPPSGGVLLGVGNTAGYGPQPIVIDLQFPGCSQGEDLDSPPNGASNPWPAGRFNGQIVVCDRGVQARVAKSNNVRLAGGGGMVLVNTAAEGESVVADSHSIPSTHVGYVGGAALKQWLSTGTGHQGRIEGVQIRNEPALGDVLAASSGRGPNPTGIGALKPDITAPGTSILAASGSGTGAAFLSGTSMASPHVAGAAALIVSARPTWTPSQIESALLATARDSVRMQDAVTPATPFDAGAGATDVSKAITAGLSFNITRAQFEAANPSNGGVPRNLNRPSLVHEDCFETCSLSRRVTDMAGGASWRVEVDVPSPATVTVTPSTFTLASGQGQDLVFNIDVSDSSFPGTWVDGRVRFVRTGGAQAANAEIPLSVFADPGNVPAKIELAGPGESGFRDVTLSGLVGLPQANFATSALVAPVQTSRTLAEDPTRDDRYDGFTTGVFFTLVRVPAATPADGLYSLIAETNSATAYDVDLFVGEDVDGDGQPDEAEELCESTGPRQVERCEIPIAAAGTERVFWVLVQNWDGGLQGSGDTAAVSDVVTLETILVPNGDGGSTSLVATGPGKTDRGESFPLRLSWNDPGLLPGERRVGFLRLGGSKAAPGQVGTVLVEVRRDISTDSAAGVLAPNATRRMRLAPGMAQDKLFIDVPPNASGLTVSTSGSGEVDLYLARMDAPTAPAIAAAPARGLAAGTSIHAGATETITLSGAALQPGRWYVTPVNAGSTAAEFDLSVAMQFGGARPVPKFGAYYNPQRSGSGLFLFPAGEGGLWGLAWYTYLQDGTPTWYLGVGSAPDAQTGVWRVAMQRFSWDGSAAAGTDVGHGQLALASDNTFTWSFELDGQAGSEPKVFIDGGSCPQLNGSLAELTGLWYSPARSGSGYSINAYPGLESNGVYFYDGDGVARWALGQAGPFGTPTMTLSQRTGFCPLCAHSSPVPTNIGTLTRSYSSDSAGSISIDLELAPPMQGTWNIDLPMLRLSDGLPCQ
jgi:subtilisin family serine protease